MPSGPRKRKAAKRRKDKGHMNIDTQSNGSDKDSVDGSFDDHESYLASPRTPDKKEEPRSLSHEDAEAVVVVEKDWEDSSEDMSVSERKGLSDSGFELESSADSSSLSSSSAPSPNSDVGHVQETRVEETEITSVDFSEHRSQEKEQNIDITTVDYAVGEEHTSQEKEQNILEITTVDYSVSEKHRSQEKEESILSIDKADEVPCIISEVKENVHVYQFGEQNTDTVVPSSAGQNTLLIEEKRVVKFQNKASWLGCCGLLDLLFARS